MILTNKDHLLDAHSKALLLTGQISDNANIGNVARALDSFELFQVGQILADSAVHAHNPVADDCAERHHVEHRLERLVESDTVSEVHYINLLY